MEKLPVEVLKDIFDHLEPDSREECSFTSQKNPWAIPQFYRPDHIDSRYCYASLRQVSRKFHDLATPCLFRNIGLRFNPKSFLRLELLAKEEALARHVRKVVFLMPYLYEQGTQGFEAFRNDQTLGLSEKRRYMLFEEQAPYYYMTAFSEQQQLMDNSYDLEILKAAFRSFKFLRQVNLLTRMVEKDRVLRDLASGYDNWEYIDCKWIPACKHAVEMLTQAICDSGSAVTSFSSSAMSPQSLILLSPKHRNIAQQAWSKLTHLEVTFDERPDRSVPNVAEVGTMLTGHNDSVAAMFQDFLHVATNLCTIHVRFIPGMPVRLPLEDAFGQTAWPKLRVLGIGSWMVRSYELIDIIQRHGRTLTGLRLNEVYLLDDDPQRWRDVVYAIKEHAPNLEWVSLDDIKYEGQYVRNLAYAETFSDTSSDAEVEDDYLYEMDRLSVRSRGSISSTTVSHQTQTVGGSGDSHDGDDGQEVVYGNVFTPSTSAGGPSSLAGSTVNRNVTHGLWVHGFLMEDKEDEEDEPPPNDDGSTVSPQQRRHWERWIMGRYSSGRPYPFELDQPEI
ncbi:hypothetical protein EX30DRAFT_236129 [Ascodesmis nigricans]|uniref:F-box domain-containing protein n=1 Tax=Ascodesmis nigricans TaxID=341454 RepID=A0A4S2MYL9_9PEZI|nr:hypothetical protein EX30DRAFT_236129 [Ascodesmis nigricans]